MATLYADASGVILRFLPTRAAEAQYPAAPEGAAASATFDEATTESLVQDLARSTDGYRVENGVLLKGTAPVTIAADGPGRQDRAALSTIDQALAAYLALQNPSAEQTAGAVKHLARVARLLIREASIRSGP
jgi:hypothetical protein